MSDINIDTPGASGANPTATASNVAVNGSAATFMRSDAAPAVQLTSSSVFGLCKVDNSTITASGGVITAIPGGGGIGNVTGPASSTDTAIATWNGTAGTALRNNSATLIDASGNISTTGKFSATGNVSGGNLTTGGVVSATGNVSGGNLTTAGVISATGNISGGNLTTAGLVSATGNVSGGNLTTAGNVTGVNIGNITPINLDGNSSHVLLGNGTFGASPGGGGNFTLITSTTTTGTAGNVTFSSIPGTYKHLLIEGQGISTGGVGANLAITFNSDTGANYHYINAFQFNGGQFSSTAFSQTELISCQLPGTGDSTVLPGHISIKINNYAATVFNKSVRAEGMYYTSNGGGFTVTDGGGLWANTAAITNIKIVPQGTTFVDGTIFSLYGLS